MEERKVGKGCDSLNGISMGTLSRSLSIPSDRSLFTRLIGLNGLRRFHGLKSLNGGGG